MVQATEFTSGISNMLNSHNYSSLQCLWQASLIKSILISIFSKPTLSFSEYCPEKGHYWFNWLSSLPMLSLALMKFQSDVQMFLFFFLFLIYTMFFSTISLLSPHHMKSLRVNIESSIGWETQFKTFLSCTKKSSMDSCWISVLSLKLGVYKLASMLPEYPPFAFLLIASLDTLLNGH